MILYHGSTDIVEYPEVRKAKYNKDFYYGFYCTQYLNQAERWATRYGKRDILINMNIFLILILTVWFLEK